VILFLNIWLVKLSFFLISTVSNGKDISSSLLSTSGLCGEEKSSLLSNDNSREENEEQCVKIIHLQY